MNLSNRPSSAPTQSPLRNAVAFVLALGASMGACSETPTGSAADPKPIPVKLVLPNAVCKVPGAPDACAKTLEVDEIAQIGDTNGDGVQETKTNVVTLDPAKGVAVGDNVEVTGQFAATGVESGQKPVVKITTPGFVAPAGYDLTDCNGNPIKTERTEDDGELCLRFDKKSTGGTGAGGAAPTEFEKACVTVTGDKGDAVDAKNCEFKDINGEKVTPADPNNGTGGAGGSGGTGGGMPAKDCETGTAFEFAVGTSHVLEATCNGETGKSNVFGVEKGKTTAVSIQTTDGKGDVCVKANLADKPFENTGVSCNKVKLSYDGVKSDVSPVLGSPSCPAGEILLPKIPVGAAEVELDCDAGNGVVATGKTVVDVKPLGYTEVSIDTTTPPPAEKPTMLCITVEKGQGPNVPRVAGCDVVIVNDANQSAVVEGGSGSDANCEGKGQYLFGQDGKLQPMEPVVVGGDAYHVNVICNQPDGIYTNWSTKVIATKGQMNGQTMHVTK